MTLNPLALEAAAQHARMKFPEESCGLIVDGFYVPCMNIAADPLVDFEIDPQVYQKHLLGGKLEAVVHSHPNGPRHPTQPDMEGQLRTDKPWVIIPLDDERLGTPIIWGGNTPIPPILGRTFMHGVTDCYSLIRDFYRLGQDELALQGIGNWPFPPIDLPDFARKDEWWADPTYDFYVVEPPKLGFVEVQMHEARAGDLFFCKIREEKFGKFNHAGVYLGDNLLAHHLPERLSRREPASLWGRHAGKWMRYAA